jgi:hypothetical protein
VGQAGNRPHARNSKVLPIGAGLVALAGVAIGLTIVVNAQGTETDPTTQAHLDVLASMNAAREEALQDIINHPESRPPKNGPVPTPGTPEPWPQGLFDYAVAPFPPGWYLFHNQWQWDIGGNHVQVYAGEFGSQSHQHGRGIIAVRVMSVDLEPQPLGGFYEAPFGTGALHIDDYEGHLLSISAETGETFYFNAETREFTDENGNPVPTDTPTPTPPPPPSPLWTLPPIEFDTPTPTATAAPTSFPTTSASAD